MSRIGKQPIAVPADIKVSIDGTVVTFEKGKLKQTLDTKGNVGVSFENNTLTFAKNSDHRQDRAYWGTYRSLASNIVTGLTTGYAKLV